MQDISDFFVQHTAFVNANRIAEASDSVLLPTTIYLGDEILFLSDKPRLVDFMTRYFQKVNEAGPMTVAFEILGQTPLRNDGLKVDIRWNFLDQAGATHHSAELTYYFRQHEDDWKIALIEVTTPVSDTFRAVRDK